MMGKINDIIEKINDKEDLKLFETEHYYIYKTLYMFLEDYLTTERLNEKTEEEILQYSNTEIYEAKQILNLLCERGILLKSNRKTLNNDLIDIYSLSYAYINNIENMIKYAKDEKTKKITNLLSKVKDNAGLNKCSSITEALIKLFLEYDFEITEKEIFNKIPHLSKGGVRESIELLCILKVINEHEGFDGELKYYTFNERILDNNEVVKTNYKEIKNKETLDFLQSHLEAYRKYNEVVLNDILDILKECFNFHVEIDNGKIDFQMGGCDYNVYLSRGYIVLEEADNSTIENTWTVEDINEFIDLIKDLKEDN